MRWLSALCPICCHHACTGHDTLPALATPPPCDYCRANSSAVCDHPAETVRCSVCEKRATVTVRLMPRPLPLFGGPLSLHCCPSCLESVKARGAVLTMTPLTPAT